MNLWGLGNLGSPISKKFQRALSVEVRDWGVGYPTDESGCGHAPVGGDGGDEEDGGDEGENISQSSSPSPPSPPSLLAKRPTTYDHTR